VWHLQPVAVSKAAVCWQWIVGHCVAPLLRMRQLSGEVLRTCVGACPPVHHAGRAQATDACIGYSVRVQAGV
jgi:hypothetical protein